MVNKKLKLCLLSSTLVVTIYVLNSLKEEDMFIKFGEHRETFNTIFNVEFKYLISNNCRTNSAIRAVQIVTSYTGNVEARSALRKAYPREELKRLGIYRVFLLSMLRPGESNVTQQEIINENYRFNDIVQGNFYDNYRNLTYKHLMGLRWAVMECKVPYIIKMDDDIVVDMYSLKDIIDSKHSEKFDFLGAKIKDLRVIRNNASKWYVSKDEFYPDMYPQFVSGWLYVLRIGAAEKLLVALKSAEFFWLDDAFVTGVLAQKANLMHSDIIEFFVIHPAYFGCCMRDRVQCGFIAGPSWKDYNLNIRFQKHSKLCHETICRKYTNGKTFKNPCVGWRKW